jgi:hypothetical protein
MTEPQYDQQDADVFYLMQEKREVQKQLREALDALKAIYTSTREDAKGQQHTIRAYLDARGVFNDDVSGSRRLVALTAAYALARAAESR